MTVIIRPIPTPVPTSTDTINFDARADPLIAALPGVVDDANAQNLENNALAAATAANATATQADRVLCQAAATAVAAQSPVANAAAAANSAAEAAVYASLAQAANPDSPIRLNPRIVTTDFTVASAYNAASAGPLAIGEGVTVAVQNNATWSVH